MGDKYAVEIAALDTYAKNLPYYSDEADKFGRLIDQSEVPDDAWGLVGLHVKDEYTNKLAELRELLEAMKQGVTSLIEKIHDTADVYQQNEDDATIAFGKHEADIDVEGKLS